jgi:hypothetical protein
LSTHLHLGLPSGPFPQSIINYKNGCCVIWKWVFLMTLFLAVKYHLSSETVIFYIVIQRINVWFRFHRNCPSNRIHYCTEHTSLKSFVLLLVCLNSLQRRPIVTKCLLIERK